MSTKSDEPVRNRKDVAALAPVPTAPADENNRGARPPAPQTPPESHRGRWIVAIIVIVAVVVGLARWRSKAHENAAAANQGKNAADRPVPVLVAAAAARDVPIYLEGLGSVLAFKTVNIHTQVDGRLVRVAFREGQAVKRGELLAEVDPRPFTIQLHQGEAALARDDAQLKGAEKNLERYAAVSAERLIPEQQTDDQRALVEQLRGTTQSDRAQIESARLNLDYARITSPIDGIVGVRQVDQGNIVHAADANGIVVVTQMDPIAVLFTLPQDYLPQVAAQLKKGPLVVEALGRDGSQTLAKGTLEVIDNQINQATATMRLKAIFPNADRALWPNQFVKTRLLVDVRKNVLVVPAVAVQRGPQGTFVYVLTPDGHADQRAVTLESTEGDQAILSKGITPGTKVVIEGQAQLRAGAKVILRDGSQQGAHKQGDGTDEGKHVTGGGGTGGHRRAAGPPSDAASGFRGTGAPAEPPR
ncbi:MAG TPA: efflux RND transporter periplasmic adaptor subunit [Polyangia bacterium]|jgi:multidrug efflux system membrane fusion protein